MFKRFSLPFSMRIMYMLFACSCLFVISCNTNNTSEKKAPQELAEVLDKKLFMQDLQGLIPANTPAEDSITIIEAYINNWIRENLLLTRAELNLSAELKDFNKQLEDYRKSLLIYAYERELINQKLDTLVSENEIAAYYDQHKNNFELKETIVKALFIKVRKNAPQLDKFRKSLRASDEESQQKVRTYCIQHTETYHLDTASWFLLDDLLQMLPVEIYDVEKFLKQGKVIELEDTDFFYFIKPGAYKIKNNLSPLSFVSDDIRNIILNQRKLKLIADLRNELYENAREKNQFTIYFNRKPDAKPQ